MTGYLLYCLTFFFQPLSNSAYCRMVCSFTVRVHNCGYYRKALKQLCKDAKQDRKFCCSGNTKDDASTTGTCHCGIYGCDGKAGPKQEVPVTEPTVPDNYIVV